jgi:SAM-dependent methyltransferase
VDPQAITKVLAQLQQATRLDVFTRPDLYELAYPGYAGDAEFYRQKGREGRVVYLGVGTGRMFAPLAAENPAAIGIERSPQMRTLFQQRHSALAPGRVLLADAATAELPDESVDTVLAPYSFLQVVDPSSLPRLLENIHRWLKPGGRLYADTFSPYLIPFRQAGIEFNIRQVSEQVRISIYALYDHLAQSMRELALIDTGGQQQVLEMNLGYYFPRELTAALEAAGFAAVQVHGGYQGEPVDTLESEVLVYEATKPCAENDANRLESGNGLPIAGPSHGATPSDSTCY